MNHSHNFKTSKNLEIIFHDVQGYSRIDRLHLKKRGKHLKKKEETPVPQEFPPHSQVAHSARAWHWGAALRKDSTLARNIGPSHSKLSGWLQGGKAK